MGTVTTCDALVTRGRCEGAYIQRGSLMTVMMDVELS